VIDLAGAEPVESEVNAASGLYAAEGRMLDFLETA